MKSYIVTFQRGDQNIMEIMVDADDDAQAVELAKQQLQVLSINIDDYKLIQLERTK